MGLTIFDSREPRDVGEPPLDYVGVRPECGCITAWLSGTHATPQEIDDFERQMHRTGREVRRERYGPRLADVCPHRQAPEAILTPEEARAVLEMVAWVDDLPFSGDRGDLERATSKLRAVA